jgi:hypothetical protein
MCLRILGLRHTVSNFSAIRRGEFAQFRGICPSFRSFGEQTESALRCSRGLWERAGGGYFNVTLRSDAPVTAAELRAAMRARP